MGGGYEVVVGVKVRRAMGGGEGAGVKMMLGIANHGNLLILQIMVQTFLYGTA